jgi:hypothetical protein
MFSAALYARVRTFLCTLHTRSRVQRASGIPCSLVLGRNGINHSGAWRREIVETYPIVIARLDRATQYSRNVND